ncbi:MAG TPA: PIN domain-containing protein [Thermoanaerobaculia bacterium]
MSRRIFLDTDVVLDLLLAREPFFAPAADLFRKLKLLVRVLPIDEKVVDLALASAFKDFEDALQYYTALAHNVVAVVTRNKRDYRAAKIPILDPRECIELFGASS